MEVLDLARSRTVLLDLVDNPNHGTYDDEEGELCRIQATDGTTTCHRYCTAFTLTTGKRLTLALTKVRSDEPTADAVERIPTASALSSSKPISTWPTAASTSSGFFAVHDSEHQ